MSPTFAEVFEAALIELEVEPEDLVIFASPDGGVLAIVNRGHVDEIRVEIKADDRRLAGDALAISEAVADLRDKLDAIE